MSSTINNLIISPNETLAPKLGPNEIGVPVTFARAMQIEECVQEHNKQTLLRYIANGRHKYPGASKFIKKSTGDEYDIESVPNLQRDSLKDGDIVLKDFNPKRGDISTEFIFGKGSIKCDLALEIGDIVMRDLINGDPVEFIHPSSLMLSTKSTLKARITHDSNFSIYIEPCTPLTASFDED